MKRKIILHLALISCIALISSAIAMTLVFYQVCFEQIKHEVTTDTHLIRNSMAFSNPYDTSHVSAMYGSLDDDALRLTWINANGDVLFDNDTNELEMQNHLNRPEIQQALKTGEGSSTRHSQTSQYDTYYHAVVLDNGTIVRVSMHIQTLRDVFISIIPVIIGILVLIFLVCVWVGNVLTRELLKPLTAVAQNYDNSLHKVRYKELEPVMQMLRTQHEKILSAATSRQDFTANVTHELKTPITAISGYAELIENNIVSQSETQRLAAQIRKSAARLLTLVCDIIQLSELDHQELPHHFENVDLYYLAREACNTLESVARSKNITLSCEGEALCVTGDASLLREMIENLIQNAITYNKAGGVVCVCVQRTEGRPTLIVKDTGIGISADQQAHIFERFYRVDKGRSRQTGGTGLGLAIVKHIADIHSAHIDVISALNKGSEFRVQF